MRKYIITSAIYAGLGLAAGVLYRELTKINNYTGRTALGMAHPHLLGLGMLFFLIIGLLAIKFKLETYKTYKAFFITYNIGMGITAAMLIVRGLFEVLNVTLNDTSNKMISIFSGLGHMVIAAGIILLFIALFKATRKNEIDSTQK